MLQEIKQATLKIGEKKTLYIVYDDVSSNLRKKKQNKKKYILWNWIC